MHGIVKEFLLPSSVSCNKGRCVIALGNFDGVHIGHSAIISKTVALAEGLSANSCVWMFDPHPMVCLTGNIQPLLTTFDERKALFAQKGIELAAIADFNAFRCMPPSDFLHFLRDELGCVGAVCGYNFSFGEYGRGKASDIVDFFGENSYVLPEMRADGMHVSSSEIRSLVSCGDVKRAALLLGRPYFISGRVVGGKRIGRTIDFPTANIELTEEKIAPACGIYASMTRVGNELYPSVTNFGTNPTVTESCRKKLETHIIGFSGDIYGESICVYLIRRIRDEKRFDSLEELRAQIERDSVYALSVFNKTEKDFV
jgi:riboflavin kinase/FMN adenylyltransferase